MIGVNGTAVFRDGRAYGTENNKKIIVLMTDGVNGLAGNGDAGSANISDYSAYGYLGVWRLGLTTPRTYDDVSRFLDERTLTACTNAKAAGVTIYTVLFSHGNLTPAQVTNSTNLLRSCASENGFFYQATDLPSLNNAFVTIAGGLSPKVRLGR